MKCDRYYIRSDVPGLPIEEQRKLLPTTENVYCDIVPKMHRRTLLRNPGLLKDRAEMLKRTGRQTPETIGVPSLRVLALNIEDLMDCLAKAAARNATIYDMETGRVFPPSEEAENLRQAAVEFGRDSRREQTKEARLVGVLAAQEAKAKRKAKRLAEARKMYGDPQYTVVQISKITGCSRTELWHEFGGITEAKKKWRKKHGDK